MARITWNPNDKSSFLILSNDNLTITSNSSSFGTVRATEGKSSGKWYWEITLDDTLVTTTGKRSEHGVSNKLHSLDVYLGADNNSRSFQPSNRYKYPTSVTYGETMASGDVLSVLLDMDNGNLEYYKNGVSMGIAFTDLLGMGEVFASDALASVGAKTTANFGATPFKYPIPNGYKSYEQPSNKTLSLSENNYMKYNKDTFSWESLGSAVPTQQQFIAHGVDDLSDWSRKIQLAGKENMILNESLGEGRVFKGSIDLKKYFDLRKVEVK